MGIAPAPPWATIYIAIHENNILPRWTSQVLFYRRFIDDIIGIWVCDEDTERNNALWARFTYDLQQWHGLEWEFSPPLPILPVHGPRPDSIRRNNSLHII
eukprot:CCRYP_004259-RB/>CCRYP_004259-RB protein AED:0.33 eAED:0.50 QI:0/-1/0/1/-1/0/1/0/99